MTHDFCRALERNDRKALKEFIDPVLADLDPDIDDQENFESLSRWLEGHDCVDSVEIVPGVLRSNPPIKEFNITTRTGGGSELRSIGIWLTDKGYRFNIK